MSPEDWEIEIDVVVRRLADPPHAFRDANFVLHMTVMDDPERSGLVAMEAGLSRALESVRSYDQ